MQRVHVYILGRVQGVGFRLAARNKMRELGIEGFVANLSDGRVGAVFAGEPREIRKMLRWCRLGPPLAQVTGIEVAKDKFWC